MNSNAVHCCPSHPCPLCHPQLFGPAYSGPLVQQGCICPPGSEATCRGPMCPRRPIGSPTASGGDAQQPSTQKPQQP